MNSPSDTVDIRSPRVRAESRSRGRTSRRPVEIGEVLDGKYLVEEVIGEGGMGIVVAAHHLELDERVALKFLRSDVMEDREIVTRFGYEAKAVAQIKNEYVARVYDVGTTPGGVPYFVMEHLEGHDLARELEERGPLPIKDAIEYGMQTAVALAVAHAKGIVHRDIKPENLFVSSRDGMSTIKVLDFGISKAALTGSVFGGPLPTLSTGKPMGTPLYMSPEQIRSADEVDARSDIWSLGAVIYELIAGVAAFSDGSAESVCAEILQQDPPPLSVQRSDVSEGLSRIIERCMNKDPDQRFQSVAELAVALLPFAPKRARLCAEMACSVLGAAGLTSSSVRVESTIPPPSPESLRQIEAPTATNSLLAAAQASFAPVPANRRTPWLLAGLGLCIALGAVGFLRHRAEPEASTTTIAAAPPRSDPPAPAAPAAMPGAAAPQGPHASQPQVADDAPPAATPPTRSVTSTTPAARAVPPRIQIAAPSVPPPTKTGGTARAPAEPTKGRPTPSAAAPQKPANDEPDLGY